MQVIPQFAFAQNCERPFRHTWIPRIFPQEANDAILNWLEGDLPWHHTRTSFYEQFELSLRVVEPPPELRFIASPSTLAAIGDWLEETFDVPIVEPVDVVAHLLLPGHKIGIHNDHLSDGETHRLLLQLGHDLEGGVTMLFEHMTPESVRRIIRPVHGSGLAFAISPRSFHAVSRVQHGRRFTIVYSFRRPGLTEDRLTELAEPVDWDFDTVDALSRWSEQNLLGPRGLTLRTYSTVRMLTGNLDAAQIHEIITIGDAQFAIEKLPVTLDHLATGQGVRLRNIAETDPRSIGAVLKEALDTIRQNMPGLFASIRCLLRTVHLLESRGPEHDVSFTLPQFPHSIFLSVPDAVSRHGVLRLAEAIVHEVLHLQLALIEKQCPLVLQDAPVELSYAPWRDEERPLSGVIHGLFVFRGIEQLWTRFPRGTHGAMEQFARARTEEVRRQCNLVQRPEAFKSLTTFGKRVFQRLVKE
jgi:hypothetical protein